MPEYPLSRVFNRTVMAARTYSFGNGSPIPIACPRMRFSCSAMISSRPMMCDAILPEAGVHAIDDLLPRCRFQELLGLLYARDGARIDLYLHQWIMRDGIDILYR